MFLIDTDVLSALRRRERHDRIVQWMSSQRDVDIHLSVVTVGEIEREIAQQKHQDPAFAQQLTVWLDQILALYSDRVLAIDLPTARHWGRLTAEVGHSSADLLIAATALEHGLTVVTCNVRHFEPTGVPMHNPIDEISGCTTVLFNNTTFVHTDKTWLNTGRRKEIPKPSPSVNSAWLSTNRDDKIAPSGCGTGRLSEPIWIGG